MSVQLTDLDSIEKILEEMSLEEKAVFVIGGSPMSSSPMEKYGIPAIHTNDCCNGLNTFQYAVENAYRELKAEGKGGDRESFGLMGGLLLAVGALQKKKAVADAAGVKIPDTQDIISYPTGISLASSWNPDTAGKCADSVAKEFLSKGIDLILSPNLNIHRDPLCGRLTESYSEDPYLVSEMASTVVKSLQNAGIIANPKHFAANSQEKDRLSINEKIPERALREIYLPGFKACVDAGALTLMSAYNKINDISCAMNKWLLTDVLRDEWGFDGAVISDWGASYEQVPSIDAGTDLTMPGPRGIKCIIDAVENGTLPIEKLNMACRNIMKVIVKSGMLTRGVVNFDLEYAKKVVEDAARDGLVLLKNEGVLPIAAGEPLAFYGKRAIKFLANSEGSGKVPSSFITNPFDYAKEILGEEKVAFGSLPKDCRNVVVVVGADGQEGTDRTTMDMDEDDKEALLQAIADAKEVGAKLILVTNSSGPVTLSAFIDDIDAILCPFFAGQAGGKIVVDAIYGHFNPSGKLPDTWPAEYCDTPAYKNYGGENKEVWYGEGIYVGYRWYDARKIKPLFPFGHGLSYTTFAFSDLSVEDTDIDADDLKVTLTVTNTGSRFGAEVVQLYIASPKSNFDKPEKELKAFKKVYLEPGTSEEVSFTITKQHLAHYYTALSNWVTEPGQYNILVGNSSRNILLSKSITINCRDPFGWTVISGIGKLITNPRAVEIMNAAIQADIMQVAAVPIQYSPDRTLKEIWQGTMMSALFKQQGRSIEDMNVAWKYINDEFKKL